MSVYKVLEEIMEERDISVADIARICSIPDSTVRGIIRRKQENIALDVAFRLSDGLDVSLEKLNGLPERVYPMPKKENTPPYSEEALRLAEDYENHMDDRGRETVRGVADMEVARYKAAQLAAIRPQSADMEASKEIAPRIVYIFPGYSIPMSAGTGQPAGDEYPENYRLRKEPPRGASFIAPISGNSMEPTYHSGDLVFVRAQDEVEIGQIGVFFMDGQQWIKECGDGELISHNSDYDPRPMTDDVRCQGLVLGVCDESYFE